MGNTIQGDGTVDGFGGGTAPTFPIRAVLQNNIAAIECSRRRPEVHHATVEDAEASIPSTAPKNRLAVGADRNDGIGILETRVHIFYPEIAVGQRDPRHIGPND